MWYCDWSMKIKYNYIKKNLILCTILILILSTIQSGLPVKIQLKELENEAYNSQAMPSKSWTLIAYLIGDSIRFDGTVIQYINQMEEIGSNSNINIVVQADYYEENDGNTIRYFIRNKSTGGSELVENLGEIDMGKPESLYNFANWAIENYPADHYSLVTYGVGNGWMGGLRDESDMSLKGFQNSLQNINKNLGKKIDLLIMLSCYMGMIEVCYQIKDYVNYYIATEAGYTDNQFSFYEATSILTNYFSHDSLEITQKIVNKSHDNNNKHLLYGMDFSKIDNATSAVNDLAEIGKEYIDDRETINNAFNQAAVYSPTLNPYPYDIIEIAECYKSSFPKESSKCEDIIDKINDFLIKPNGEIFREHWNVISIYFSDEKDSDDMYLYKQLDFAKNSLWLSFLEEYYKSSSTRKIYRNILDLLSNINKDHHRIFYNIFEYLNLINK